MTRDRLRATRTWVLIAPIFLSVMVSLGADGPSAPPSDKPVLFLGDGGYVAGSLHDSDSPDVLRWKNELFAAPFDFIPARVDAIRWPAPGAGAKPSGEFQFETAGGDLLFGSLVSLGDKEAELDVVPYGRIRLDRSRLKRMTTLGAKGGVIYAGPNGLAGWEAPSPNGWREEGGNLISNVPGSSIRSDVGLPARAAVELEISWSKKSSFIIALGVGKDDESVRRAFHLEVIDDQLVALVETKTDADVAPLQKVSDQPGRAHVVILVDSEKGRFAVVSPEGRKLADLRVQPREGVSPGGVYLANALGDVRLERLRIDPWDGMMPSEAPSGASQIIRKDGPPVSGTKVTYDRTAKQLVATSDSGDTRLLLDQVAGVRFSPAVDDTLRWFRLTTLDGSRVSGNLVKVADSSLWLAVPGIAEPLKVPINGLRTVHPINQDLKGRTLTARNGLLELEGAKLKGWLVDGAGRADASCLVWQPTGSKSASPLATGVSGRIVYKESKVEKPTPEQQSAQQMRRMMIMQQGGQMMTRSAPVPLEPGKKLLHLRSGDMVVADVTKIDEDGVWFKSASSDKTFVAHDKVKAIELGPAVRRTVVLNRTKFDRLLTLPRMQKGSPPTHLLRSTNGDYLRGRVVSMDDKKLGFEVRLDTREIPRERIARITWFHADESDPAKPQPIPPVPPGQTRVQAVRPDGIRLTFLADRFADGMIRGQSEVFGGCRVRPEEIDQILIGGAIERSAAELAQQQWKLHNAPDPKYAQEGDQDTGTESDLIGKPAPDFTLDLVGDGKKKFHLADAKGSIVILDFWATWCGPCLQAMPQVEKVADEFKDRGVKLIAVNLQETPDQITALLTKLKLHPTVALDRDGVVAGKYKANAIPQTVIIDREGKVARLFVGSSPDLQDKLRDAIDSLISPKKPNPAPTDVPKGADAPATKAPTVPMP